MQPAEKFSMVPRPILWPPLILTSAQLSKVSAGISVQRRQTMQRASENSDSCENSDSLTANYSVKQNQFTKLTSELPRYWP